MTAICCEPEDAKVWTGSESAVTRTRTVLLSVRDDVVPGQVNGEPAAGGPLPYSAQHCADQAHGNQEEHNLEYFRSALKVK